MQGGTAQSHSAADLLGDDVDERDGLNSPGSPYSTPPTSPTHSGSGSGGSARVVSGEKERERSRSLERSLDSIEDVSIQIQEAEREALQAQVEAAQAQEEAKRRLELLREREHQVEEKTQAAQRQRAAEDESARIAEEAKAKAAKEKERALLVKEAAARTVEAVKAGARERASQIVTNMETLRLKHSRATLNASLQQWRSRTVEMNTEEGAFALGFKALSLKQVGPFCEWRDGTSVSREHRVREAAREAAQRAVIEQADAQRAAVADQRAQHHWGSWMEHNALGRWRTVVAEERVRQFQYGLSIDRWMLRCITSSFAELCGFAKAKREHAEELTRQQRDAQEEEARSHQAELKGAAQSRGAHERSVKFAPWLEVGWRSSSSAAHTATASGALELEHLQHSSTGTANELPEVCHPNTI